MARNENIKVALRLRPVNVREEAEKDQDIWEISSNSISLKPNSAQTLHEQKKIPSVPKRYSYDYCFTPDDSNTTLYQKMIRNVILASLEGYNATVFVYGQTGSGKTYTMLGADSVEAPQKHPVHRTEDSGIIILALKDLFAAVPAPPEKRYFFTCSYMEIYNEQVYDLLAPERFRGEISLVSEDPQRGFYVKPLSEHIVSSFEAALE